MSGVYIPNIEMPKSCSVCPMLEGDRMDGLCHAASKWLDDDEHWTWYVYPEGDMDDSKPCNCPLVPVPPHGRLIDADAVMEKLQKQRWNYQMLDDSQTADKIMHGLFRAEQIINESPTIIPAEGKPIDTEFWGEEYAEAKGFTE